MVKSTISPKEFDTTAQWLQDPQKSMAIRFRALFTLKNIGGQSAIDHIGKVLFEDDSALLKHECAYCLGQMQDVYAIEILSKVLANTMEHPMVRHEAGEALGAIGTDECLEILENYVDDSNKDVAETAQLAVNRIKHFRNRDSDCSNGTSDHSIYSSVDPAPPLGLKNNDKKMIENLRQVLIDPNESLFKRYQAMFSLRNLNTDESAMALADGLDCQDSALFRHEIAFVLGQMQRPITTAKLAKVLAEKSENEMVRHECAEALGAIATEETNQILKDYLDDDTRVVRESAIVALDVSDYNNSEQFQFLNN
ncbi:hypothetical protein DERP_010286 [Dermatophagoides pteronyssinus]|uniref:Uncharacterized protein n=2 Tax=Dermatophagoides pteronyssinus TaxID=6956 RepID=A0ABQ8IYN4_DERPT|nr:deoxyhypusine hydroxylase-like [Dermatophagoides pteronyssinus]KAH9415430.1 hypothetical protein DERP_010286 [Dermatophagoides pteronyssinus]